MEFEWDDAKSRTNRRKHGVSFAKAASAFDDPLAVLFADPDHSDDEQREILVGWSDRFRLLVVSFTERPPNVRIISARAATAAEQPRHAEHLRGATGNE